MQGRVRVLHYEASSHRRRCAPGHASRRLRDDHAQGGQHGPAPMDQLRLPEALQAEDLHGTQSGTLQPCPARRAQCLWVSSVSRRHSRPDTWRARRPISAWRACHAWALQGMSSILQKQLKTLRQRAALGVGPPYQGLRSGHARDLVLCPLTHNSAAQAISNVQTTHQHNSKGKNNPCHTLTTLACKKAAA